MSKILLYIIAAVVAITALLSCNTSGCLENRSSIPLAGFYSSATGGAISVNSMTITGIGHDTSLYDGTTALSQVYLPMRSTQQSTGWVLAVEATYTDGADVQKVRIGDTLTFGYTASPYFASDECGVIYRYHITKMAYTTNLIDSIVIADSLITNVDTERIKIYMRTKQPEEDK